MSVVPEPISTDENGGKTQAFQLLLEQLAHLSQSDLAPPDYFGTLLQVLLPALPATAGAVWERFAPDRLRLQAQRQMPPAALIPTGASECGVLRLRSFEDAQLLLVSAVSGAQEEAPRPIAFIPIVVNSKVARVIEVWFEPDDSEPSLRDGCQLLGKAAVLAAGYLHNYQRQVVQGQQQIWAQLDAFVRTIHGSLNPTEIAVYVANESRRLVSCDRCSVAVRLGDTVRVAAVSGLEMIEKRSNLVRRLRELCERVMDWGEPLEFTGTRDDSLPGAVLDALDNYLAESNCRFLTVLPLRDKREVEGSQPRSALVMECFDSTSKHRQLTERLRVLGQHACSALYNATEYQNIPLRLLWGPLVRLRQGLGSKTRLLLASIATGLLLLVAILLWIPYPLKMDARGDLLPEDRAWVYSPVEGQVVGLAPGVTPGAQVTANQSLILMYDPQLQLRMVQLQSEIASYQRDIVALAAQGDVTLSLAEKQAISGERKKREYALERKVKELRAMCDRARALEDRPGHFWLLSPQNGTVLNSDFRESLVHRTVKPSEALLRVGDKSGRWEVQLKIPQQHLGQVLLAFNSDDPQDELDVDLLLLSAPTRTFKGKLARGNLGSEASPVKEDSDSKPVLLATVRIDGMGIDASAQIPRTLLVAGTEVHAKVRCGQRRLGYSLFYGVWEFFYEKVVFFF
jgi:hypothetical protein